MKNYFSILVVVLMIVSSCTKHEKREVKYDNGQLKELFIVKEIKDGNFIKDGEYNTWFENGQVGISGQYSNGKKTGNWKSWFENGQIESDHNFSIDSLNGAFAEWYVTGQKLVEGNFAMDKEVGEWTTWFENGQIMHKNKYSKNGDLDGTQISWYENGKKESEKVYSSGKKEGQFTSWDSEGNEIMQRTFEENQDINLPATYINYTGVKLFLDNEEAFQITYLKKELFSSNWKTASGKFKISNGILYLEGFNKYSLQKFNADTITIAGDLILLREREK